MMRKAGFCVTMLLALAASFNTGNVAAEKVTEREPERKKHHVRTRGARSLKKEKPPTERPSEVPTSSPSATCAQDSCVICLEQAGCASYSYSTTPSSSPSLSQIPSLSRIPSSVPSSVPTKQSKKGSRKLMPKRSSKESPSASHTPSASYTPSAAPSMFADTEFCASCNQNCCDVFQAYPLLTSTVRSRGLASCARTRGPARRSSTTVYRAYSTQNMIAARNMDGTGTPYFDELAFLVVTSPSGNVESRVIRRFQDFCECLVQLEPTLSEIYVVDTPGPADITDMFGTEFGSFTVDILVYNLDGLGGWDPLFVVPQS